MLSDVKTGEEGSKPTRTLFMVSCASLVLSILLLLICVLVILKTRKKRPFFLNLFLGSQYAFFTLTLILYLTVKAMVDYEIENGREEGYEEDYGTICCIVYFLWSGTSLNALAMCIILRASSVWKRSRAILSLAIQGICLLIIPGIMIGLCIHFSTDGLKSFGTALNALLYIEGKEWSWDIEKDSEAIILILYLSITFTIFLIIGGAFLFKMCRRIYKGIRMKDMGIPGIFPDQIICSSEVDMFKYKITFLPLGFYLLTGYLFIVSQTTNDYEALDSVCFLIPLGFLFLSNLYCIYLFFTFSLRRFEVPFFPGIQTLGRPVITKLPHLSESTLRSIQKYFPENTSENMELKDLATSTSDARWNQSRY